MPPKTHAPKKTRTPLEIAKIMWKTQPFSLEDFLKICDTIDTAKRDKEGNSFIHWILQNFPNIEFPKTGRRPEYIESIVQIINALSQDERNDLLFRPNKKNHLLIHILATLPDLNAAFSLIKTIHDTNPKDNRVVMTSTKFKYDSKAAEAIAAPVLGKDEDRYTLAHYLATRANRGAIFELLSLYEIIDINLKSSNGQTPLCVAIQSRELTFLHYMFRQKNKSLPILGKKRPKLEESLEAMKILTHAKLDKRRRQEVLETLQNELRLIETEDKTRADEIKKGIKAIVEFRKLSRHQNSSAPKASHSALSTPAEEGKEEKKEGKAAISSRSSSSSSSTPVAAASAKQAVPTPEIPSSASASLSSSSPSLSSTPIITPSASSSSSDPSAAKAKNMEAYDFGKAIAERQVKEKKDFKTSPKELLEHLEKNNKSTSPDYKDSLEQGYYDGIYLAATEHQKTNPEPLYILGNEGIIDGYDVAESYFHNHCHSAEDLNNLQKSEDFLKSHLIKPEEGYGRNYQRYNDCFQLNFNNIILNYRMVMLYGTKHSKPEDLKDTKKLESFIHSHLIKPESSDDFYFERYNNHALINNFYAIINMCIRNLAMRSHAEEGKEEEKKESPKAEMETPDRSLSSSSSPAPTSSSRSSSEPTAQQTFFNQAKTIWSESTIWRKSWEIKNFKTICKKLDFTLPDENGDHFPSWAINHFPSPLTTTEKEIRIAELMYGILNFPSKKRSEFINHSFLCKLMTLTDISLSLQILNGFDEKLISFNLDKIAESTPVEWKHGEEKIPLQHYLATCHDRVEIFKILLLKKIIRNINLIYNKKTILCHTLETSNIKLLTYLFEPTDEGKPIPDKKYPLIDASPFAIKLLMKNIDISEEEKTILRILKSRIANLNSKETQTLKQAIRIHAPNDEIFNSTIKCLPNHSERKEEKTSPDSSSSSSIPTTPLEKMKFIWQHSWNQSKFLESYKIHNEGLTESTYRNDTFINWAISHLSPNRNKEEKTAREEQISQILKIITRWKRPKRITILTSIDSSNHIFLHKLVALPDPSEVIDILKVTCCDDVDFHNYSPDTIEEPVRWDDYPGKLYTLQHYLAIRSNHGETLEKLLMHQIIKDINLKSSDGKTILCYALGHHDNLLLRHLFRIKDENGNPITKKCPNISESPDAIQLLATPISPDAPASRREAVALLKNHMDMLNRTGRSELVNKITKAIEKYQEAKSEEKSPASLSSSSSISSRLSSSPVSSASSSAPGLSSSLVSSTAAASFSSAPGLSSSPVSSAAAASSSSAPGLSSSLVSSAAAASSSSRPPKENKVAYEMGKLIGHNQVLRTKSFTASPDKLNEHLIKIFGNSPYPTEYKRSLEAGYHSEITSAAKKAPSYHDSSKTLYLAPKAKAPRLYKAKDKPKLQ